MTLTKQHIVYLRKLRSMAEQYVDRFGTNVINIGSDTRPHNPGEWDLDSLCKYIHTILLQGFYSEAGSDKYESDQEMLNDTKYVYKQLKRELRVHTD